MGEEKLILAREKIEEYKGDYPNDMDSSSMSAILDYCNGEFDKAELKIEEMLAKFPFNFSLNYNMAIISFANNNYEKSIKYYYRACMLSDDEEERLSLIGNIEYMEKEGLIDSYTNLKILKEVREVFEFSYRGFPAKIGGEVHTGQMILENNKEGYYVGMYDYYRTRVDGIYLENAKQLHSFYKTEMIKSKYIRNLDLTFKGKHILPICIRNNDGEVKLNVDGRSYELSNNMKNRFYYYPVDTGRVELRSEKDIVLGNPIKVEKDNEKPSLVLNIFIDGLSQTIIEKYGLKGLMPNTYEYFSKGTLCNNVYAAGEWTYVNLASFFTGDYTTNHGMFHPSFNTTLKEDKLILSEVLQKDGYFTSKIGGAWRSVPTYDYIRGMDRFVYQSSLRGMNVGEVISEAIEHIEAFKDMNKFLWISLNELHDVADNLDGRLVTQVNDSISSRFAKEENNTTSVRQGFNNHKKDKYITQIKRLDIYLGILFNYLEKEYSDDEILVSLISDHGQGYLIEEGKAFLSENRTKVPFMFRGKNMNQGVCDELIEGIDLLPIILKSLNIKDEYKNERDANLPVYFGGENERGFTYTESIFPGSTYKATIMDMEHEFNFETEGLVSVDGRVDFGAYKYKLVNKITGIIETDTYTEKVESYFNNVFEHIKDRIIY